MLLGRLLQLLAQPDRTHRVSHGLSRRRDVRSPLPDAVPLPFGTLVDGPELRKFVLHLPLPLLTLLPRQSRVITSGLVRVEFRDFFIGDEL